MSIYDKISNAQETTWLTDGIAEAEAKSIIELAKISAKIERRRLELNMTQKEFAAYMNVSQGMVSRWESREYNFTIKTLNEICQKLNLHLQLDLTPVIGKQNYTVLKWNSESTQNNKQNNWVKYIKIRRLLHNGTEFNSYRNRITRCFRCKTYRRQHHCRYRK